MASEYGVIEYGVEEYGTLAVSVGSHRHHGAHGAIFLQGTSGGALSQLSSGAAWALQWECEPVDITPMLAPHRFYLHAAARVGGSFEAFWDDTEGKVFTAAAQRDGVTLTLYPDYANNPGQYLSGLAVLDYTLNAAHQDAVKLAATFAALGPWTIAF